MFDELTEIRLYKLDEQVSLIHTEDNTRHNLLKKASVFRKYIVESQTDCVVAFMEAVLRIRVNGIIGY